MINEDSGIIPSKKYEDFLDPFSQDSRTINTEDSNINRDIEVLCRAIIQEKMCENILQYQDELVKNICELVIAQVKGIEK